LGVKLPNKRMVLIIIFLILIGSIWYGYGIYQLRSSDVGDRNSHIIKIALLQTNFLSGSEFNAYQKTEVFKAVLDLFKSPKAISEKAELVIAPEGFGIVSLTKNKEIAKYLLKDFWQPGQVFLENQKVIANTTSKSRLFYYDLEKESPIAFHDKMLLVPNGDYLPYLTKAILNICSFGIGTEYEQRLHQRGEKINVAHLPAGKAGSSKGNIGGTICSSIVSPEINRKMTKNGAEFLVVVSSDAPFHGSKTLLAQNLAMSKLRAIENRRYFAQATNMGYSFLLNPKGEIIVKTSQFGNKILFSSIYLLNKKTIYTKFNDWIVILAALVLILFFIKTVIHIRRFT